MAAQITVEQFTDSVAKQIANDLNIEPGLFVNKLVEKLSKGLIDKIVQKQISAPILQQQSKETTTTQPASKDSLGIKQIQDTVKTGFQSIQQSLNLSNNTFKSIKSILEKSFDDTVVSQREDKLPTILKSFFKKASTQFEQNKQVKETTLQKVESKIDSISLKDLLKDLPEEISSKIDSISLKSKEAPETKLESKEGVLNDLVKIVTENFKKQSKIKKETPISLLEKTQEATPFLFDGFTEKGLQEISEHLPKIIGSGVAEAIKNASTAQGEQGAGMMGGLGFPMLPPMSIIKGALGVLGSIGGLFVLLYGLQTDGPFKGLAKIISEFMLNVSGFTKFVDNAIRGLISGIIKIPEKIIGMAKSFTSAIGTTLLKIPGASFFAKLIDDAFKGLIDKIVKVPEKIIGLTKSFTNAIGAMVLKIPGVSTLTDLAKPLLTSATGFLKSFAQRIISIPMQFLGSIGKSLSGLFGSAGGTILKTGLEGLKNFIPRMFQGVMQALGKLPIVGSLISIGFAVSRFKSGDYVGAGIDILSGLSNLLYLVPGGAALALPIGLGLSALNAFLDFKTGGIGEGKKGKGELIMDWIKGLGEWVYKKFEDVPVIGSLIKGVRSLTKGNYLESLKHFAQATPTAMLFNFFAKSETVRNVASTVSDWVGSFSKWAKEKILNVPVIGSMIKGVSKLISDPLGSLKEMAFAIPGVQSLVSFFQSPIQNIQKGISAGANWLKNFSSWVWEKFQNLPVIGPLIKGVQKIFSGNIMDGLKEIAKGSPIGMVVDFLSKTEIGQNVTSTAVNFGNWFKGVKDMMLKKLLQFIPEKILGISVRNRVAKLLGIDLGEPSDDPSIPPPSETAEASDVETTVSKQVETAARKSRRSRSKSKTSADQNNDTTPEVVEPNPFEGDEELLGALLSPEAEKFGESISNSYAETTNKKSSEKKEIEQKIVDLTKHLEDEKLNQKSFAKIDRSDPIELEQFKIREERISKTDSELRSLQNKLEKIDKFLAKSQEKGVDTKNPTPVADALIDNKGGLVVSSPIEGSLYQLSKNDGIVAAPFESGDKSLEGSKDKFSSTKTDSILEKIAQNSDKTNQNIANLVMGFNGLATALGKLGVSIAENPSGTTIVNNNSKGGSSVGGTNATQLGKSGNQTISNFRSMIESVRQQPA